MPIRSMTNTFAGSFWHAAYLAGCRRESEARRGGFSAAFRGQLDLNQGLKRTFTSDLEQEQVAYLDMTDYTKNQNFQLFWNQHYHLKQKWPPVGSSSAFPVLFGSIDPAPISCSYPVEARAHKNT